MMPSPASCDSVAFLSAVPMWVGSAGCTRDAIVNGEFSSMMNVTRSRSERTARRGDQPADSARRKNSEGRTRVLSEVLDVDRAHALELDDGLLLGDVEQLRLALLSHRRGTPQPEPGPLGLVQLEHLVRLEHAEGERVAAEPQRRRLVVPLGDLLECGLGRRVARVARTLRVDGEVEQCAAVIVERDDLERLRAARSESPGSVALEPVATRQTEARGAPLDVACGDLGEQLARLVEPVVDIERVEESLPHVRLSAEPAVREQRLDPRVALLRRRRRRRRGTVRLALGQRRRDAERDLERKLRQVSVGAALPDGAEVVPANGSKGHVSQWPTDRGVRRTHAGRSLRSRVLFSLFLLSAAARTPSTAYLASRGTAVERVGSISSPDAVGTASAVGKTTRTNDLYRCWAKSTRSARDGGGVSLASERREQGRAARTGDDLLVTAPIAEVVVAKVTLPQAHVSTRATDCSQTRKRGRNAHFEAQ